jgi:hypothetical protein
MMRESEHISWQKVQSPLELETFINTHFRHTGLEFYFDHLKENLMMHEERLHNPLYLPFVSQALYMAAGYQFPDLVNHETRHTRKGWKRDLLSPVHILALGVTLAHWTIKTQEAKERILQSWEGQSEEFLKEHVPTLMNTWVLPHETFPTPQEYFQKPKRYRDGRIRLGLPLIVPDMTFVHQVSQIPLTGDLADRISKDAFKKEFLPLTKEVFFPTENPDLVSNLFLNDQATWNAK